MSRNRAYTRHQRARVINNRRRNYDVRTAPACDEDKHNPENWVPTPRGLGALAKTPHPCSCMSCCNRRALEGPTIQELRHEETEEETHWA